MAKTLVLAALLLVVQQCRAAALQFSSLTDAELDEALSALLAEKQIRAAASAKANATVAFRYAHKKTYATADPIKAAYFLQDYFGATADHSPYQHHCDDTSMEEPQTKNANFPATAEQPNGFTIHFVRNPHKAPYSGRAFQNASALGLAVEQWRGSTWGDSNTNRFDQYMDNHLGLVFDSLDPLIALWRRDKIPFVCRTWFCGPGLPQYERGQCPSNVTNTRFGETGCYIEAPHGIIVEALCPLGQGLAKTLSDCLSTVSPDTFELCSSSRR